MIIEISIAVVAAAFVVLAVFLIILITDIRKTLSEFGKISADLKKKVEAFNPLFHSITHAGEMLEHETSILKKRLLTPSFSQNKKDEKNETGSDVSLAAAAIFELAVLGIHLWQKNKKRRGSHERT